MTSLTPIALGLNHRSAPIEVRERVAFTQTELANALPELRQQIGKGVILSTCNRTELYSTTTDPSGCRDALLRFLGSHRNIDAGELATYTYVYTGGEALNHLFRVASGLDSMILGESQVLGQVREAYSMAMAHGHAGGPLSKMFHTALRVGKRARTETDIGRNALSISSTAVELARRALGDLHGRRVMVVGAGTAGKLVAKALEGSGVEHLVVVNRTLERAQELASQLGGEAASFKEMRDLLGSTDIVVSSTDAPGLVIQLDMLEDVMPTRRGSPLLIVDIAVPRDVDPRVSGLEGVVLYDLDDLESLSEANRAKRQKEVAAVEEMIEQETAKFMEQWDSMDVAPVIAALREQAETMRCQELEKTLKRMPDLSEEDTERIEALTRSLIKKMLHSPISVIRERKDLELLDVARDLFSLNGQSPRAEKEPRDT